MRFAKAVGFDSASQMQKVIRDGLIAGSAVLGYSERVRQFSENAARKGGRPADVLAEFVEGNVLALPVEVTLEPWRVAWGSACIGLTCEGISGYFCNSIRMVVPFPPNVQVPGSRAWTSPAATKGRA